MSYEGGRQNAQKISLGSKIYVKSQYLLEIQNDEGEGSMTFPILPIEMLFGERKNGAPWCPTYRAEGIFSTEIMSQIPFSSRIIAIHFT